MTPSRPVMMSTSGTVAGTIKDLQQKIDAAKLMGERLARFLQKAFPVALEEAAELGGALSDYLTCGMPEYLEQLKNTPEPEAYPSHWLPPTAEERLVQLVRDRDALVAQMEEVEHVAIKFEESGQDGPAAMVRAQLSLQGITARLEAVNDEISKLQARMEEARA